MSRAQLIVALLLWLALMTVSGAAVQRHHLSLDVSANAGNTLSAASVALLATLDAPVRITAFAAPDADIRKAMNARLQAYRRARPDLTVEFVDPARDPIRARELGIGDGAELVIEYKSRRENLRRFSEHAISAAIQRLAQDSVAKVLFISGHGERDPDSTEQAGYSTLTAALRDKGMTVQRFLLATNATIPADTNVVVVAAPEHGLLAGEQARLADYVNAGGNLLWLQDPGTPAIPQLSATLGVQLQPGTIVYQDYDLLGTGHPALALVAEYGRHPAVGDLQELTVFPVTGGLELSPATDWQAQPLLASVDRSWLNAGRVATPPVFTPGDDTRGPILFGAALERDTGQRVIVIADSDFLSNAFLGQLANRPLGVALLQWLAHRDAQLDIDIPAARDARLNLSPAGIRGLALLFALILPTILIGGGLLLSWRRRHQHR